MMQLPTNVVGALAEGRHAYIAIDTPKGPHVTPELYVWSQKTLWIAAAATTLKARNLQSIPAAAAVVSLPGRDVMLSGPVEAFDARRPDQLVRRAAQMPGAVAAGARYALRNASDVLAFAGDVLTGKIGKGIPPARIFFALRPDRVAVAEGDELVETWNWPSENVTSHTTPAGGERAVVAFLGPVALRGWWFEDARRVFVPPGVLALAEPAKQGPIAVVVDEYNAPGPAAKTGRLYRGEGTITDEAGFIDVGAGNVVEWDGVDVEPVVRGS